MTIFEKHFSESSFGEIGQWLSSLGDSVILWKKEGGLRDQGKAQCGKSYVRSELELVQGLRWSDVGAEPGITKMVRLFGARTKKRWLHLIKKKKIF